MLPVEGQESAGTAALPPLNEPAAGPGMRAQVSAALSVRVPLAGCTRARFLTLGFAALSHAGSRLRSADGSGSFSPRQSGSQREPGIFGAFWW